MEMIYDKLFLLKPNFEDPAYPEQYFYCWQCALIEGLLQYFPQHGGDLEVKRIDWPRPRKEVIDLVGEENQSLPLLILKGKGRLSFQTDIYRERAFITDPYKILAALSERHGFPQPHP